MALRFITREVIEGFLSGVDRTYGAVGSVYLIGETTQVVEGWRRFTDEIEFCSSVDASRRDEFNRAVVQSAGDLGVRACDEFPGEVIPLPSGFRNRERPLTVPGAFENLNLAISHFDPYAVSFRFIARGGETDYQLVMRYLEHEWMDWDTMTALLDALLPEFSFETIQQDPAEFRRRYGGLYQMWKQRRLGAGKSEPNRLPVN